ncbi:unnamed protein product [Alternaria alternata]
MSREKELVLFGGDKGWKASDWTDSDDRVRGGASQSYLTITGSSARFHGNLDITTLGGAGFASQRTTGEDRTWDLSAYDGYTLTLKDEILPLMPDGREQSTISYEYDFESQSKLVSLALKKAIFDLTINSIKAVAQPDDIEKGIIGSEKGTGEQEPWSWKKSESRWAGSYPGFDMGYLMGILLVERI